MATNRRYTHSIYLLPFGSAGINRFSRSGRCIIWAQMSALKTKEIRGRPFQFAFDGVLFVFEPAKPALVVLFRLQNTHGARTPEDGFRLTASTMQNPYFPF